MGTILSKLGSRKLWVTILTVVAVVLGGGEAEGIDTAKVTTMVGAGLAALYVLVEGLVDRAREKAKVTATSLPAGSAEALAQLVTLLQQSHAAAVAGSSVSAAPAPPTKAVTSALLLAGLIACSPQTGNSAGVAQEQDPCSTLALAELEANYVRTILAACTGQTLETCEAASEIEQEHHRQLEAWARCQ